MTAALDRVAHAPELGRNLISTCRASNTPSAPFVRLLRHETIPGDKRRSVPCLQLANVIRAVREKQSCGDLDSWVPVRQLPRAHNGSGADGLQHRQRSRGRHRRAWRGGRQQQQWVLVGHGRAGGGGGARLRPSAGSPRR